MPAEVTGHAQKQAWVERVLPPVEQVQEGLWSIPVKIPIKPLRYVLVYVLELADGIAIVDAGWNDEHSYETLEAGLAQGGYQVADIRDILITHVHPDHFGLAKRLRDETGARIQMHRVEATTLVSNQEQSPVKWESDIEVGARRQGIPDDEREQMKREARHFHDFVDHVAPDVVLEDGEPVAVGGWDLQAVWTPGHTSGHLCYLDAGRKVMFTGDHVLPRITPNISVHSTNPEHALSSYLDSLRKVAQIADGIPGLEGLPGHEYRFAGMRERAEELSEHHEERLAELTDLVRADPGITSWQISQRLTWTRPWETFAFPERRAALGEAASHVELLHQRGVVRPEESDGTRGWYLSS